MRHRKIFKRRDDGRSLRVLLLILGVAGISVLSFSAGYEFGRSDSSTLISWAIGQAEAAAPSWE